MPASRKLLLGAFLLYVLLPLPWIVWRPEGLFYTFDLRLLPDIGAAMAVFVAGWVIGESLRLRGNRFTPAAATTMSRTGAATPPGSDRTRWPVALAAIWLGLACSWCANAALYAMGALVIDEATGRQRIPVVTTLGSAHILSLILSGCLLLLPGRVSRPSRATVVAAALSVATTIGVGLIEGRRTAVVLPLLVYVALAAVAGNRRALKMILGLVPVFVAMFAITTYARTNVDDTPDVPGEAWIIAGDALVGRLGNPTLILDPILSDIREARHPVDPHTVQSLLSGFPNLGWVAPPFDTGYGNELGRSLGLLPDDNDFTGINSGWIGELLLDGGYLAVFFGALVLGWLAATMWQLLSERHPAGMFLRVMVVVFVLSGFQMEVPFPIESLVRAAAIALMLALAERAVARRGGRS